MRARAFRRRGVLFVLAMLMVVVLSMLAGALVTVGRQDYHSSTYFRDKMRALEVARGGLNHAIHVLSYDPGFAGNLSYGNSELGYRVAFDGSLPVSQRSLNNLLASGLHNDVGVTGQTVLEGYAEIVSVGRAGRARTVVRASVTRGVSFNRAVGALGKVDIAGPLEARGISSLLHPTQETGGGIYSWSAGANAINLSSAAPILGSTVRFETPAGAAGVNSSVPAVLAQSGQISSNGIAQPEFDVVRAVASKSAAPPPSEMFLAGGVQTLPSTHIAGDRYVNGNLTIQGDLNLAGGSLYVNGTVTLNGGVLGTGSMMASGDVKVVGGTSILNTNQSSGAAVYSGANISLTGIDAGGYIQSLAAGDTALDAAYNAYVANISAAQTVAGMPASTATEVDDKSNKVRLLAGDGSYSPANYWINPIPGPSGYRAIQRDDAPIPSLINQLKSSLGPAYATDARAQKIVQALEEEAFFFRSDHKLTNVTASELLPNYKVSGAVPGDFAWPTAPRLIDQGIGGWDGSSLLPDGDPHNWNYQWTRADLPHYAGHFLDLGIDQQHRALIGPGSAVLPEAAPLLAAFNGNVKQFLDNHPANLNWLSTSNFQGLLYAQNNVSVGGNFRVVGAVMAKGKASFSGNTTLIYNQEYFRVRGSLAPVTVLALEEL